MVAYELGQHESLSSHLRAVDIIPWHGSNLSDYLRQRVARVESGRQRERGGLSRRFAWRCVYLRTAESVDRNQDRRSNLEHDQRCLWRWHRLDNVYGSQADDAMLWDGGNCCQSSSVQPAAVGHGNRDDRREYSWRLHGLRGWNRHDYRRANTTFKQHGRRWAIRGL